MKKLLLTILGIILLIPSISEASNDEIVWEKDYPVLVGDDFLLLDGQNTFLVYSRNKIYELSISTGELQDSISFEDYFKNINKISITDDGRYLALSGDNPYLIIWDLENNIEYKRYTAKILEDASEEINSQNYWTSASISSDGTKITAILKNKITDYYTRLIVFDVTTDDTLMNQLRNLRGQTKYDITSGWVSTEFSPNDNYLVAQLDVRNISAGENAHDSLLIYKTNPLTIDNTIINSYSNPGYPTRQFNFSSYENILATTIENENKLILYNLDTKEIRTKIFESYPYSLVFSNNSSNFIFNLYNKTYIYDYNNMQEKYSYSNRVWANIVTQNDSKIIGYGGPNVICVNSYWNKTPVENNLSPTILYPNPVNSILKINFNVSVGANFKYDIFDINSNKVATNSLSFLQTGMNEVNINFISYPSQTYYLKIYSSNESYDFKIIKE